MSKPDMTVVVAVDKRNVEYLRLTLPNWKKYRPDLFKFPWLFIIDEEVSLDPTTLLIAIERTPLNLTSATPECGRSSLVAWCPSTVYESQREKMLTAWICVPPKEVKTEWWMKIDCDAIALDYRPLEEWLDPTWFEPDSIGRYNNYIASGWSYSKSKGGGGTIEEWAEKLQLWGDQFTGLPRLDFEGKIRDGKLRYKRMASWISYYRTEWTQALLEDLPGPRLPVPSQDTVAFYYAERRQDKCLKAKQKRRGWSNVSSLHRLREKLATL